MPASPLVSVLIPTFNGADRIACALQSIFDQTVLERGGNLVEVIVIVDGSTDETEAAMAPFADRIRVLRQANGGGGAALNHGLSVAGGTYVALLDDDDVWFPRKLETQLAFMEAHPTCIGCAVPWETSTRPGVPVSRPDEVCGSDQMVDRPIRKHFDQVFWRPSFALMRRSAMAGLQFSTDRDCPYDREFDLAFFGRGPIGIAGTTILGRYRIHGQNVSRSRQRGYRGTLRLRRLQREGVFDHLDGDQRDDFEYFMGRRTRHFMVEALQVGARRRALDLLRREWRALHRANATRFALASPLMLLLPTSVLQRAWPNRGVLHGA